MPITVELSENDILELLRRNAEAERAAGLQAEAVGNLVAGLAANLPTHAYADISNRAYNIADKIRSIEPGPSCWLLFNLLARKGIAIEREFSLIEGDTSSGWKISQAESGPAPPDA